jgi:hypothetical protein
MANHTLLRWIIGLSSVSLFTGLVGFSQQLDQNNPSITTNDSSQTQQRLDDQQNGQAQLGDDNHNAQSNDDAIRNEWGGMQSFGTGDPSANPNEGFHSHGKIRSRAS